MTQGTPYNLQSLERFFGTYCKVEINEYYGKPFTATGLLYPEVDRASISERSVGLYLTNGVSYTYPIRAIAAIHSEEVSPKAATALTKLYQTLLTHNEALIKAEQERLKMEEKLKKLREKSEGLKAKAEKQAAAVTTALGFVSRDKLKQALQQILLEAGASWTTDTSGFDPEEVLKFRHYLVRFRTLTDGLAICFDYSLDLEKWAQNKNYDFIEEEYDGTYSIMSNQTEDYRALIAKHSRPLKSLKAEGLSSKEVRCSQSYDLELGDKYWLTFEDRASFVVKADVFTKDTLKTAQKTLKAFIKR